MPVEFADRLRTRLEKPLPHNPHLRRWTIRVTGMGIGFLDVTPEEAGEYNRWWELVMGPENAALPEIVQARRYVATPDLQRLRGPIEEPGFDAGRANYCHMYMFGTEDLAAAQASMGALARRLSAEGRYLKGRRSARYQGPHRLVSTHVRKGVSVSPDAVPYLGHVAVQFSIGMITDKSYLQQVEAWYNEVHLPDILEAPGYLAVMRLLPIDPEREGRFINLFLLDDEPANTVAGLRSLFPSLRERGRLAVPGRAVRLVFGGPFRPIMPLKSPSHKPLSPLS